MTEKKTAEKTHFDNYEFAKVVKECSQKKLLKIKIGLIISTIVTVLSVISFCTSSAEVRITLLPMAFLGSIVSYIVGGGITIALRAALKIGKFGWVVCPFPLDIFTGIMSLVFAFYCFFFMPVVFVFINYCQNRKDYNRAVEYLNCCKSDEVTEE